MERFLGDLSQLVIITENFFKWIFIEAPSLWVKYSKEGGVGRVLLLTNRRNSLVLIFDCEREK